MPRFFMHLRDGTDELLDNEGIETTIEAVPTAALKAARDCIAGDVLSGRIELRYWIDVHDEQDAVVHTLSFADAVVIVPG
jgi:hypothetical protein